MTQHYTPAQLEALLNEATPGPWIAKGRYIGTPSHMSYVAEVRDQNGNWSNTAKSRRDAALIAAAPDLARLVLERDAEIARLKAAAEDLVGLCSADVKMNGTTYQPMPNRSAFTKAVERMIELINDARQAMKETSDDHD